MGDADQAGVGGRSAGLSAVWWPDAGGRIHRATAAGGDREDSASLRSLGSGAAALDRRARMLPSTSAMACRTPWRRLPTSRRNSPTWTKRPSGRRSDFARPRAGHRDGACQLRDSPLIWVRPTITELSESSQRASWGACCRAGGCKKAKAAAAFGHSATPLTTLFFRARLSGRGKSFFLSLGGQPAADRRRPRGGRSVDPLPQGGA